MDELIRLEEPTLLFGHGQSMEDPRDGLTIFGPLDAGKPYGIQPGVIGTRDGIRRFKEWVEKIQHPLVNENDGIGHPPFVGFEEAFRIPWNRQPALEIAVPEDELRQAVYLDDRYQRVYKTVEVYARRIIDAVKQEEAKVDLWFVVIPDIVYKYCRPLSNVEAPLAIEAEYKLKVKAAKALKLQPSLLYPGDNLAAVPYHFEVNFHNQLKARLLEYSQATQIVRESTIAHRDFLNRFGSPERDLDALQSAIAWNICTAAFYKVGGRPWKISNVREGVCYIGLVFKRDDTARDLKSACCAAQMFLDSGDGVVFKGAVGPWYSPGTGDYHLSRDAARQLVGMAVESYKRLHGQPPRELFLHGKVRFEVDEWRGFRDAVTDKTNIVGVRIRDERSLKLYRKAKHPVLRGLAYVRDDRTAFLWTKGFTPRLQTYPGREVPKPLLIDVCRGDAEIHTVLGDIMALTKLNYNSCVFADGDPVTLVFADAVGEILTAGPVRDVPPLPFKYYI